MSRRSHDLPAVVVHRDVPNDPREHRTDGRSCWCNPSIKRLLPRRLFRLNRNVEPPA